MKGFHCNKNILHIFLFGRERNKVLRYFFKFKVKVKLWTATAYETETAPAPYISCCWQPLSNLLAVSTAERP